MNKSETVTPFQLFSVTLFSMLFGLNFYPSTIAHQIEPEWFIAQIISVFLMFPILFMLLYIFEKSESNKFGDIIRELLGNIPSRAFCAVLAVYFLLRALSLILLESNNIQLFLFDRTPAFVVALVIAVVGFFLSVSGVKSLAKLCELLAVPILLLVIIILGVYLSGSSFEEIKTLFQPTFKNIFSQVTKTVTCFSCVEITLLFICRTENKKKRKPALLVGYSFCAVIMLVLTLCIVGTFTLKAGADLVYPVTELARTVQFQYLRVIERFDAVMLSVSITYTCVFTSLACYCATQLLEAVFHPLKFRYSVPVSVVLILLIIFGFKESFTDTVSRILLCCDTVFLIAVIPLLFVLTLIKKKGAKNASW